jgi:hypothetical protein
MGFASNYLNERTLFPKLIDEAPDIQTGIIVVVPSYDEPGIEKMLDSLAACEIPACGVEVIVVVNAPSEASSESLENNRLTIKNILSWKKKNSDCFFRLFAFMADSTMVTGWGVGLARKTGMDEAIRRFDLIDRPDGVILCLDADCTVKNNYFVSVCNELYLDKSKTACSIYFEHPLEGTEFHKNIYESALLYELHLRYLYQGMLYSGFPYAFHTVGSSMAIKAFVYIKSGGMNRKRAGEDFYFIQKLIYDDGYFSLNNTVVYPSPRSSFRVPFGTGASVTKIISETRPSLLTYNSLAYSELKLLFDTIENIYGSGIEALKYNFDNLPEGLKCYIGKSEWIEKITEIFGNTSGYKSFRKRFFNWFNMFKMVKYLNMAHQNIFDKQPVELAAEELLKKKGFICADKSDYELLMTYRRLEKRIDV